MSPGPAQYPGRAPIDAYGNGGFRFAGMSHRGSILCLPQSITAWDVTDAAGVTPAALAPVLDQAERAKVVLLGTGRTQVFPSAQVREALRQAGQVLDVMDTGAACRTYNLLLAEGRPVAAALIAVE